MGRDISYTYVFEVKPGDWVQVPGCEPTSEITSNTLNQFLNCKHSLIKLTTVLNNIPGSFVEFSYNGGNFRKKFLRLPPILPDCPCTNYPDYFEILRQLDDPETPFTPPSDCDVVTQSSFCPSPDFRTSTPVQPSPYIQEGSCTPVVGQSNGSDGFLIY